MKKLKTEKLRSRGSSDKNHKITEYFKYFSVSMKTKFVYHISARLKTAPRQQNPCLLAFTSKKITS